MESTQQENTEPTFDQFLEFHGIQLYAVNFPKALEKRLFEKLRRQEFDIGSTVKIIVNEEEEKVELQNTKKELKKEEDAYLIDHAWTFKYRDAEKTLRENEGLLERMTSMVQYSEKQELPNNPYQKKRMPFIDYIKTLNEETKVYDFDDYGITILDHIPFSQVAEEISLFNNNIENPGQVTSHFLPMPNLKALWLNGNPCVDSCVNFNQIGEYMPALEVLNSKFTSKASDWAMLFYARPQQTNNDVSLIKSLDLSGKGLLHMDDISVFDRMTSLETLNVSDHEDFLKTDEQIRDEQKEQKSGSPDEDNIEFVQRKHTIDDLLNKLKYVKKLECDEDLEQYILQHRPVKQFLPALREINRVSITLVVSEDRIKEKKIRHVMDKIWMYVGTYRIVSESQMDDENAWYITDEVGSAMRHSDQPNMAVHPFIYSPNNKMDSHTITYSICWPVRDIKEGETIYRDFLAGIDESKFRSARLSVWFNTPEQYFEEQLKIYRGIKPNENPDEVHKQFQEKYQPVASIDSEFPHTPIKVYADYIQIQDHLKDPRFQLVEDPKDADIVWMTVDYYNIVRQQLQLDEEKQYFNQFQYEGSFVMKHHLANMIRLTLKEEDQDVIQETYVLEDFLPSFVGSYQEKKRLAEENTWILKPINMARSMDMWVTSNLDQIMRLAETGPKIAQKYIYNPCLYKGKKFDMRFVALLKSVLPLEVYVYDEFYTRHSNNAYEMSESSFSEYETHFTVMNYKAGVTLQNVRYFDFEKEFNQEYAGIITFDVIKKRIYEAIKKVFLAFQVKHGKDLEKLGNASQRCRSIYGIDVMINDRFEPKILEATFSPDCKRACRFNPEYFNEVFGCLFFNDTKNMNRII